MEKLHLNFSGLGQYHFALTDYNLDNSVYCLDLTIFTWVRVSVF